MHSCCCALCLPTAQRLCYIFSVYVSIERLTTLLHNCNMYTCCCCNSGNCVCSFGLAAIRQSSNIFFTNGIYDPFTACGPTVNISDTITTASYGMICNCMQCPLFCNCNILSKLVFASDYALKQFLVCSLSTSQTPLPLQPAVCSALHHYISISDICRMRAAIANVEIANDNVASSKQCVSLKCMTQSADGTQLG